jgi:ribose transport system substrate-binding protein
MMLHSIIGVKAELVGPTGYQPNAELGVFREIVEQHPAEICLSAGRPEIFQAEIDQAVAQGIPVICVDSDVADSKRVLYIGTDNFKAGTESLKQIATLVPGGGSVAVITITDSATSTIEWRAWRTR